MKIALALLLVISTAVAAPTKKQEKQAREHYDRGMSKYALREFDAAVEEFKAAYSLTQAPGLLFNLGQASRLAKKHEDALHFYRTYLRLMPDAPNRKDVERFIHQVEPLVRNAPSRPAEPAAAPPPAVESGPETTKAPEPPTAPPKPVEPAPVAKPAIVQAAPPPVRVASRRLPPSGTPELAAGVTVLGAGVALLAAGIAVGVSADSASSRIAETASTRGAWSADLREAWDQGQRDATTATALYVIGGAAAITGTILTAVGGARRAARGRWSVAPAPGGAHVAWSCAF